MRRPVPEVSRAIKPGKGEELLLLGIDYKKRSGLEAEISVIFSNPSK